MKIFIETIPYEHMRYPTLGDYYVDSYGFWHIKVVETPGNNDYLLIALHELVEKTLCHAAGIPDSAIDTFDINWRPHDGIWEPGDDPAAPYYQQHQQAMIMERMFAAFLKIDWIPYENRCASYSILPSMSDPPHPEG